jgi:hypothetical protein
MPDESAGAGRDLFIRLGEMERRCTVKMASFYSSADAIESVLRWRVTITPNDHPGPPITVEGQSAVDTLNEALDRAEHIGWHL